ncbi:MAG: hypothetical protein Kow002_04100 [Anaerolineales bacterium]
MISLVYVFWMYVALFGVIGALRGWVKELMVVFSVVLALATNHLLHRFVPVVNSLAPASSELFWVRTIVLLVLVFFGYQTVVSIQRLAARAARERLQDTLFGIFMGAINGYLIAGSVLYYLHYAEYFPKFIQPPTGADMEQLARMLDWMPPNLLGEPGIYFALVVCFIFVIVVFI